MTDETTDTSTDEQLVRRGYVDSTMTGRALRSSVAFEMAEQRLAARGRFWSQTQRQFENVA